MIVRLFRAAPLATLVMTLMLMETPAVQAAEAATWQPPPGLPDFPQNAARMSRDKEEAFQAALARMATTDDAARRAARAEIRAMGAGVLPYLVAGSNYPHVEARAACMALIGELNGRNATKQVIEAFYAAMPESGAAPTYQTPFLQEIKRTLAAITGQSFIEVSMRRSLAREGLDEYVAWYDANWDRLPPQLGEPKLDPTSPDYMKQLREARALKLEHRSWPVPPMPAEIVRGTRESTRPEPTAEDIMRPEDRKILDTVPTVDRQEAFRR
jgi:hypothetical protein